MKIENLMDSKQEQSILLNNLHELVFKFKVDGTLISVNAMWGRSLQYEETESTKMNMQNLLCEGQTKMWNEVTLRLAGGQWVFPIELTLRKKDGAEAVVVGSLHPVGEGYETVIGIFADVTAVRRAEKERDRLFLFSVDLLCITGYDGFLNRVNPAFQRTLGFSETDFLNKPFLKFVHPEDKSKTLDGFSSLRQGVPSVYFENRFQHKDGGYRWLSWTGHPVVSEGLIYAIAHDITEQRETEASLKQMAFSDELTGLFNRRGFFVVAERMLRIAQRKKLGFTLLMADLDGLKHINDQWGHSEGDAALLAAAQILKGRFRDSDAVSRFGGDEFVAACLTDTAKQGEQLCRDIEERMTSYNKKNLQPYALIFSVGFSFAASSDRVSLEGLIASADRDMYTVKLNRRKPAGVR